MEVQLVLTDVLEAPPDLPALLQRQAELTACEVSSGQLDQEPATLQRIR